MTAGPGLARTGVQVALLDPDGVIVAVNEAWSRFAVADGGDPSRTGVGASYLDVCDSMGADEPSTALAAAVRAAIGGDPPASMMIRISCDSPQAPRRLDVLVASRVSTSGERLGATVSLSPRSEADPERPTLPVQSRARISDVPSEPSLADRSVLDPGEPLRRVPGQAATPTRGEARLRVLLEATTVAAGDLSLPMVLHRIVAAARELVAAPYAALGRLGSDGTVVELVHTGVDQTVGPVGGLPDAETLLMMLTTDPRPGSAEHAAATVEPPRTGLLEVPVRAQGQVVAHLCLPRSARPDLTDEDGRVLAALAGTAGVAIENARLLARAAEQRRWLEASTEMTQRLFAGGSDDPLDLVLGYAAQGAAADFARVVVRHDDRHGRVQAQVGSVDHRNPGDLLDLQDTLCGRILATAEPVLVSDYASEFTEHLRRTGIRDGIGAVAGVPLLDSHDRVLGALLVVRNAGRTPFTEHDLGLLESFAEHARIGIALDRARSDREARVLLAEHDRIAHDLQDHVIAQLFATGMGLSGLVPHQRQPDHQTRLLGYVDGLDDTIASIRRIIFDLHHRPPAGQGLRERLMTVLDDERPALGLAVRIDFSGNLDEDIPEDLVDEAVAVLGEAVSNIARHSRADSAAIRVARTGRVLEILVSDDGTGIKDLIWGSGLSDLRRRAEAHQGTFLVISPASGGTHLVWTASLRS